MTIITEKDQGFLRQRFEQTLQRDVTVKLFTESVARSLLTMPGQAPNPMAQLAQDLARELTDLSPKLKLEVLDFRGDGADAAAALGVDRVPALILGDDDAGDRIRFYGTPVGNEFGTIIEALEGLSQDTPHLSPHVADVARRYIQELVHLQVFVTPT